jgi:hypothetical protein
LKTRNAPFAGDTSTINLDLALAVVVALGLPWLALWLLGWTGGALSSLALYYAVCGVVLYRWRLGRLDYERPARWPWGWFGAGLLVAGAITARNWGALPDYGAPWGEVWLTAVIWGGFNAALEQFAWLYVLVAWRNRWASGPLRLVGLAVGAILLLALVSLIHIVFWAEVLPEARATALSWLTVPLNTLLTLTYIMMYFRARSFWPTFVVHFLVDLQLVLLARYSILPYL